MATITLNELGTYNSGKILCRNFQLSDERTLDKEIQEWLDELTEETGQLCEEWIIADSEGIPSRYVGEFGLDPEFWDWLELDMDEEVKEAGIACGIAVADMEEAYAGKFRNDEEFAYDMAESTGMLKDSAEWPHSCIDWKHAAYELMFDYCESNGHYFRML